MLEVFSKLKWRQIITTATASYLMICVGMSMTWSSPVLRKLHGRNSPLPRRTTTQEDEWIGSLILLGGTFGIPTQIQGPMFTVPLTRYIGRRAIIIVSTFPLLLGWLLAGLATNVYYLYAARFLWGCTMGSAFMMIPIYIGEIAEDSIRGALGAMFTQNLNLGFFLGFLVGRFATYWGLAASGGVISLVYLVLSWSLPETPLYLVYSGRNAEASSVLQKLRGASEEDVSAELRTLEAAVEREYKEKPQFSDLWSTKGSLKALGICVALSMLIQLSGINVILFYLEELFGKVKVKMSAADAPVVVGAMQTISSSITPLIVERLGRRFLLYTTTLAMTVVLTIIGIYTLLDTYYKYNVSSVAYLPLVFLIIYIILFTWGVGPIPLILVSEMFRPKVKCLASAICSTLCWFSGFLLTRFYSDLTDACGTYTGFWMLAVFCAAGAAFSFFLLTETKGKTFDEIQDILNNKTTERKPTV